MSNPFVHERFVYDHTSTLWQNRNHPARARERAITENRRHTLLESPLHLLRRALQSYTAQWNATVGEVTPPQYAVLVTVHERPGIDQTRLGEITGIDFATLAPLVHRLEQRGVLAREVDPANRRRKVLTLTEEGARALDRIRPLAASVDAHVLGDLPTDTRAAFLTTLHRIAGTEHPEP